jgi:hypothetical protein
MDLEEALRITAENVSRRTARAEALEAEAAEEREALKADEDDLAALFRVARNLGLMEPAPPLPAEDKWLAMDRTMAVMAVLLEASSPLRPADIASVLQSHGRTDDYEQVSATLAHLKRGAKATQTGRAQWVAHERSWQNDPDLWDPEEGASQAEELAG